MSRIKCNPEYNRKMNFIIDSSSLSENSIPSIAESDRLVSCNLVTSTELRQEKTTLESSKHHNSTPSHFRLLDLKRSQMRMTVDLDQARKKQLANEPSSVPELVSTSEEMIPSVLAIHQSRPKKLLLAKKTGIHVPPKSDPVVFKSEGHFEKFNIVNLSSPGNLAHAISSGFVPQPQGDSEPLTEEDAVTPVSHFSKSTDLFGPQRRMKLPTLLLAGWDKLAPYKTPKTGKRQLCQNGFSEAADAICRGRHRGPQSQFAWTPAVARDRPLSSAFQRAEARADTQMTVQQLATEESMLSPSKHNFGQSNTPAVHRCNLQRATELQTPGNSQGCQLDTNVDWGHLLRDMPQLRELLHRGETDVRS